MTPNKYIVNAINIEKQAIKTNNSIKRKIQEELRTANHIKKNSNERSDIIFWTSVAKRLKEKIQTINLLIKQNKENIIFLNK